MYRQFGFHTNVLRPHRDSAVRIIDPANPSDVNEYRFGNARQRDAFVLGLDTAAALTGITIRHILPNPAGQ